MNVLTTLFGAVLNAGESIATVESASATVQDIEMVSLTATNIWMLLCAMLVFIMALGFAVLEAGFTQAKNTVNILFKNTVDLAIGIITYAYFGFNLMYPGEFNGYIGFAGWGLSLPDGYTAVGYAGGNYTYWTDFLFQAMFAATCATIVSGAVAERIKISAYFIFTFFLVGLIYPILGSWKWGAGWLDTLGFYDFAGSTIVHSVGGWAALAGIIVLGPRLGKYANGKVNDLPGSSVPLAVIGVFMLWMGWFGFNGGSVLSADPESISIVLVNTTLAAAAGALGGVIGGQLVFKRLDLGMVINGILAGLVGITAGADLMSYNESILIGIFCGVVVVYSAKFFDTLRLDDCVGAVSVHLTCGVIGTLACGVLGSKAGGGQFVNQLIGVASYGAVAFFGSLLVFYVLKMSMGIRVTEEHERSGLDSHEHGIRGYTITYDE